MTRVGCAETPLYNLACDESLGEIPPLCKGGDDL